MVLSFEFLVFKHSFNALRSLRSHCDLCVHVFTAEAPRTLRKRKE